MLILSSENQIRPVVGLQHQKRATDIKIKIDCNERVKWVIGDVKGLLQALMHSDSTNTWLHTIQKIKMNRDAIQV